MHGAPPLSMCLGLCVLKPCAPVKSTQAHRRMGAATSARLTQSSTTCTLPNMSTVTSVLLRPASLIWPLMKNSSASAAITMTTLRTHTPARLVFMSSSVLTAGSRCPCMAPSLLVEDGEQCGVLRPSEVVVGPLAHLVELAPRLVELQGQAAHVARVLVAVLPRRIPLA